MISVIPTNKVYMSILMDSVHGKSFTQRNNSITSPICLQLCIAMPLHHNLTYQLRFHRAFCLGSILDAEFTGSWVQHRRSILITYSLQCRLTFHPNHLLMMVSIHFDPTGLVLSECKSSITSQMWTHEQSNVYHTLITPSVCVASELRVASENFLSVGNVECQPVHLKQNFDADSLQHVVLLGCNLRT